MLDPTDVTIWSQEIPTWNQWPPHPNTIEQHLVAQLGDREQSSRHSGLHHGLLISRNMTKYKAKNNIYPIHIKCSFT